ncbi:carboxypeptidase-like regulatory domain-containing protein [Endozoicomonas numazuensis]|uniref:DUF6795 domain-containing protein n=1 Tax=Endozoicomonas numazuensis TaxID=1137799 RepID=UPI000691510A|nr:carboxypeptidase-like regulatory domain-containing protein [Endozoicomonas numazuensis]
MSIFDVGKMCTFSKISGVILNNGQPVAGAKIIRETRYEKTFSDQAVTDDNGYFEMPALFVRSIAKFLPMEFGAWQSMKIVLDGTEHKIWGATKTSKEENSESKGKPLIVTCDLSDDEQVFQVSGETFFTKCKWDVEKDEPLFSDGVYFDDQIKDDNSEDVN